MCMFSNPRTATEGLTLTLFARCRYSTAETATRRASSSPAAIARRTPEEMRE